MELNTYGHLVFLWCTRHDARAVHQPRIDELGNGIEAMALLRKTATLAAEYHAAGGASAELEGTGKQ